MELNFTLSLHILKWGYKVTKDKKEVHPLASCSRLQRMKTTLISIKVYYALLICFKTHFHPYPRKLYRYESDSRINGPESSRFRPNCDKDLLVQK